MIADAMAMYPEPAPGWKVVVRDAEQTGPEMEAALADCTGTAGKPKCPGWSRGL